MMMKRLLLILLCCLLPWSVLADGPRPFDDRYLSMSPEELAACMEAAMSAADLPGAKVCRYADGSPVMTQASEQDALCVARRTDGLLTLCCFTPREGQLALKWHNDVLLSYYQELTFSAKGAAWSGGVLPVMSLQDNGSLSFRLDLLENVCLLLACDGYHGDWTVLDISACAVAPDGSLVPLLTFHHRDLADWIRLAHCHPGNWLDTEDASW